jgi:ADP-L-glycero-D-manno-heptose 6-epimerase
MLLESWQIEDIRFPEELVGKYQSFTRADLTQSRGAGCDRAFVDVSLGVSR